MALRLVMARLDCGVLPATYSRRMYLSSWDETRSRVGMSAGMFLSLSRSKRICLPSPEIKPDQNSFGVGQVPDDFANRHRKFAHYSWHRQNLVALRELRIFHQIDDLDAVAAGEMFLAELFEIAKCGDGFGSRP